MRDRLTICAGIAIQWINAASALRLAGDLPGARRCLRYARHAMRMKV